MQFVQFQLGDFATGAAIPFGKCTVYLTGTATLAALFDSTGASITNPVVADVNAQLGFAAADGTYDYQPQYANGSAAGPKIKKQQLYDLSNISSAGVSVLTRTALAAITGPTNNTIRYLVEAGREGWFKFSSANLSANVTADPQQGVYVPPAAATTGASGAWVRIYDRFLNIRWFGATGDGTTNDSTAVQAAINLSYALRQVNTVLYYGAGGGLPVYVPPAAVSYNCASTKITRSHSCTIFGNDNGEPSGGSCVLQWNGTTIGIEDASTASGAITEGITFQGGFAGGAEGEFHAIKRKTNSQVRQCQFYNWPGDAVNDDENFGGPFQTNGASIQQIYTENCRCSRKNFGGDANAGSAIGIQSKANRQAGALEGSFLGDHYYSGSINGAALTSWNTGASGRPVSYCSQGGNWYTVVYGQETWAAANAPTGTTASNTGWIYWSAGGVATGVPAWFNGIAVRAGGAYVHTGLNNRALFAACYAEDNNPSQFDRSVMLVQPFMSARFSVSAGVYYGKADALSGDALRMVFAAASTPKVELGRLSVQAISTVSNTDFWNTQGISGGIAVRIRFQNGLELDGITPANLGSERFESSTNSPASAEGTWYLATRTYAGTGGMTDRLTYSGPSDLFGPVGDNLTLSGSLTARWKGVNTYYLNAKGSILSIDPAAGIGYGTGAGSTIAQATSKSTAVTINTVCGQITMNAAALASGAAVFFTVNNSSLAAADAIDLVLASGYATAGTYNCQAEKIAAGSFIIWVKNISGGSLSEALVFNFAISRGSNS